VSGFGGFVLRRGVGTVITLLAISVIVYVVFFVTPGNVAQITCGPRCSPEQVHQVAQQLRLDDPLYLRYWHFLQGILVGQDYSTGTSVEHCSAPCLGLSYQGDQQVTQLILAKLPVSLSLVFGSMVLWLILGVGTGILSAWRRGRFTERLLTGITLAGVATPVFVIGLVLMIVVCAVRRPHRRPRTVGLEPAAALALPGPHRGRDVRPAHPGVDAGDARRGPHPHLPRVRRR
jgi:peptide/nickel transport system permease protein